MKKNLYPDVQSNVDFPTLEKNILKYWKTHNIFQKSIDQRSGSDEFIFYDGPPFANGLPHYGHLLTGFIKDVFARYQTMKGKKVERRFGWDCHGLPAEMGAEKELGISGRLAITEFGIDKFNDCCRNSVMKYTCEWEDYVTRQARWVDFENGYKTMDTSFMESVLWAFKELYKKGLIYQSMKVMPYSWACQTPLSNFETRLDNAYRSRADNSITVNFVLKNKPQAAPSGYSEYRVLAWTTTPWTLPSNLALALKPDMDYAFVPKGNICYIIGKFAIGKYAKELGINTEEEFSTVKGKELEGLSYEPIFDYFVNHQNSFKILGGEFVAEGEGTGVVHMAPGFGEDDQILCEKHGIELVCPVDNAGKFTSEVRDFVGQNVFEANDGIIIKLKKQGSWIKTEQTIRNYPHCWRTDTPLIYRAVSSWYVKVTAVKDRMVELNQQINWIPGNIKDGIFGKWLENARDWSISRNRFWGTPIPIWQSDDPKYPRIDVYGSAEELEKDFSVKINDLHRPFVDTLTRPNPDDPTGKSIMRRVEDVFDCWFESSSMPYAQVHYPFENKEWFKDNFPADFIAEYVAQTRAWFYTLLVLSTALFDKPPFLNAICHGVILDTAGQKLSKRLNNYADPLEIFDKYGADALRVTMLSSTVVKGEELLIDKDGKMIYDTLRLFIKPIWNAYHFFTLYANADQIEASLDLTSTNMLDRYILSKLKITIELIEKSLDHFDTQGAYAAIGNFFEVLNNWYIRRSRNRFWRNEKDTDKISAYNTLYSCLELISRAMSPLLPILAEEIYLGITGNKDNASVHLTNFPNLKDISIDQDLVKNMDQVLDICNSALFVRQSKNIRVRQPLKSITIITENNLHLSMFEELIKDEINVKSIIYREDLKNFATVKLIINFPIVGKRLPSKMKEIINDSKQSKWEIKDYKLHISGEVLLSEEFSLSLEPKSNEGAKALTSTKGVVILDLELDEELYNEGIARDLIRCIQQARKEARLDVSAHIKVQIDTKLNVSKILEKHGDFIMQQTLSTFSDVNTPDFINELDLQDEKVIIKIAL